MHAPSPRCVRLSVVLKRIKAESGFCRCPEVLFAACELGVFDLLAEAPEALGSAAVAARLGISSRGTELLLDACVSLKLLQVEVRREKGGSRALAKACMSLYPRSQVTMFDIPDVVQMAERHFSFPEDERIAFCEGVWNRPHGERNDRGFLSFLPAWDDVCMGGSQILSRQEGVSTLTSPCKLMFPRRAAEPRASPGWLCRETWRGHSVSPPPHGYCCRSPAVMVNSMRQLSFIAHRGPDSWSNVILGVSGRVSLDEMGM
ncbi:acetylserotonin O-methyltransferase isoform X2 [Balaenoptera musculus]|uniref:Acetylserotonin O-methyltransferase isoform X2 n=1 Tax=Balaenoptera musculus TaxID=9771 RepID=A0A8B8WHS1_BALMU|nr:acetylserotonin O-methyltransferase isoform X2 [Balaenoptera musculus]